MSRFVKVIVTYLLLLHATIVASLDLTASSWIWTTEYIGSSAPAGSRAFRKTLTSPPGKSAIFADIVITTDNFYVLYVNGALIGQRTNSNDWQQAGRFCVGLNPTLNVIAVNGTNESTGRAGVLAAIQVSYADGSTSTTVTDVSWRATSSLPSGFQSPTFNDAAWPATIISGTYGAWPYAPIAVPAGAAACASCIES